MNEFFPDEFETNRDIKSQKWRKKAACAPVAAENPDMEDAWIKEFAWGRHRAERICAECPVRMFCLVDAIDDPESDGLRGGFYFEGGALTREEERIMYMSLELHARTRRRNSQHAHEEDRDIMSSEDYFGDKENVQTRND